MGIAKVEEDDLPPMLLQAEGLAVLVHRVTERLRVLRWLVEPAVELVLVVFPEGDPVRQARAGGNREPQRPEEDNQDGEDAKPEGGDA
jgi:hypothetical protein